MGGVYLVVSRKDQCEQMCSGVLCQYVREVGSGEFDICMILTQSFLHVSTVVL